MTTPPGMLTEDEKETILNVLRFKVTQEECDLIERAIGTDRLTVAPQPAQDIRDAACGGGGYHYTRDGHGIIEAVCKMFARGTWLLGEGDALIPVQEAYLAYKKYDADPRLHAPEGAATEAQVLEIEKRHEQTISEIQNNFGAAYSSRITDAYQIHRDRATLLRHLRDRPAVVRAAMFDIVEAQLTKYARLLSPLSEELAEWITDAILAAPGLFVKAELPSRQFIAYNLATAQWKRLHPKKIPPLWVMVEAGGTDGSPSANHLLGAYKDADALLSALRGERE